MTAPALLHADARNLPLEDDSVDLIVTSPPYFGLRSYTDDGEHYETQLGAEATPAEFVDALIECTREMMRVLKPSGSLWINLGDRYSTGNSGQSGMSKLGEQYRGGGHTQAVAKVGTGRIAGVPSKSLLGIPWRYAIRCIDELGLILRAEVIWSKPNGLPESVKDRVRRSHEQWFHFTLEPRYFSAVDEIREAHAPASLKRFSTPLKPTSRANDAERYGSARDGIDAGHEPNPLGKLPGSVWEIATQPLKVPDELGVDHFAAFPMEWPRRIIFGWSPREVCTACGEGRRPVADQDRVDAGGAKHRPTLGHVTATGTPDRRQGNRRAIVSTVTGYACACPDISAPSKPGVVLDPFGGTGTTALVATMHGRHGISVDASMDYCRLAQWRCSDPKQRAYAAGADPAKVETPVAGQVSMFDLLGGEVA